uniref:Uncharacterized protein n=1 Tax=Rousettus aegyptiacus TaxID=9407 RepID=A0A7J8IM74_ROUAE|nr:hypothetical protein HJG63_010822 [Rousettus aegyptiacus]
MSRVFLTGLRGGGTGLGHMALLSMVMDAAWTTYPQVPCVLRKTACLLHREFSGTRLFLCTDPNVRKAALVLVVLCGLGMEGGPGVCASFMPDASQPVRLLCRICVQESPGVDGSLDEPGLSGVHGALVSAFGGVLCQGFTAPISPITPTHRILPIGTSGHKSHFLEGSLMSSTLQGM